MEAKIYDINAKEKDTVSLRPELFGLPWNADLVHQVVTSLNSSKRKPVAHTKTRGEVRGGGKKPWQQKGTGRARHGSSRSPIWVGGGVTHGPRNEKNFERKVSKKMKSKALYTILSRKFKDGEVLFLDRMDLKEPKTKFAIEALKSLSAVKGFNTLFSKKKNATLFLLSTKSKEIERSMSNLGNVEVKEARNLDPLSLMKYKYLVIENPEIAIKAFPSQSVSK